MTTLTAPRPSWSRERAVVGAVLFLLLAGLQIAIPLSDSAVVALTTAVVVTLVSVTMVLATFSLGMKQIFGFLLMTVVVTVLIEMIGVRTGLPFGRYHYENALQPQLGGVPVIVPLAWFAMGLPAWEISRRLVRFGPLQWLVGGLLLAAWDLLLDPQMVTNGFWTWEADGAWQGIPLSNYAGWTLTGFLLCALYSRFAPTTTPNPWLVVVFLWMAGFTAFGFLLPFVFDVPVVGMVGGLCTVIPAVLALRKYERPWAR